MSLCFRSDSQSSSVAVSPDWHEAFPGVISANLSSDAWPLTPAVLVVHVLVSSHEASAFPTAYVGRHFAYCSRKTTSCRRVFSGLQAVLDVQASEFAHHPGRSDRRIGPYPRPPWLLRPRISRFVTSPSSGYAHRPNRAIDGRGTCTLQDLRPCRPLLGKSNAILPAACGRIPPAAGGYGPQSRHAAWRQAALLEKAL